MALKIKSIPELIGKEAEIFIKNADCAQTGSVGFTEQIEISRQIIEKSTRKMKTIFLIIIVSVLSACTEIEVKPIDYAGDPVSSASKERGITIK